MSGLYAVQFGAFRFEIVRSEDDPRVWCVNPRSFAAWNALGSPDRAPRFGSFRAAISEVGAIQQAYLLDGKFP